MSKTPLPPYSLASKTRPIRKNHIKQVIIRIVNSLMVPLKQAHNCYYINERIEEIEKNRYEY